MKGRVIKTIAFLFIFIILLYFITKILWIEPNPIAYFYKEPKDSLDVVYLGSSNAYIHFNTTLAYNLYGYTTGMLSTDSQPFILIKNLLIEAQSRQDPSLYVIDIAKASSELSTFPDSNFRKTVDSMKFNKNRIQTINYFLSYRDNVETKDYIDFYFSFFLYHNKWKRPSYRIVTGNKTLFKGYMLKKDTVETNSIELNDWLEEREELSEETKEILNDLIDYIKTNNLNVLFVLPKKAYLEDTNKKLNSVIDILESNNLKVMNFNTLDDFQGIIDPSKDYYNDNHLNVYGSTKYTLYFSKYLKQNYNLEDHRNDKSYNSWNKEYERLKKKYTQLTEKNFEELLIDE